VARPREGRIIASVLATAGINDWLQSGFTLLCNRANVTGRQADLPEERFTGATVG
jgi:hypothetical protein